MARGAVTKRVRADGAVSWRVVYDLGPDPGTGKRRQRSETVRGSKREADALLAKRLVELEQEQVVIDRTVRVDAYLRDWIASYATTRRASTGVQRGYDVEHYLIPKIGALRLTQLKPAHIQAMYRDYERLSRGTISHMHSTLSVAMNAAVRSGLLLRNPCQRVTLPRPHEREVEFWLPDQVRAFLAFTRETPLHVAWVLLAYAHLRIAELAALRWDDVDWNRSILRVQRTVASAKIGAGIANEVVNPPKTKSGRRSILLPDVAMECLRTHKIAQNHRSQLLGRQWADGGWVVENGYGARLSRDGVRSRFQREVERSGLPRITPKGLRHSGATMMLAAGIHPEIARERLGHSDVSVTIGTYSHSMIEMQEATVGRLEQMIGLPALESGED